MINIDAEISKDWITPSEGFNQHAMNDTDNYMVRFAIGALDRCMTAGEETVWIKKLGAFA